MRARKEGAPDAAGDFRSHGWFDPLDARRLLPQLERAGIRFRVTGSSRLVAGAGATQARRFDQVEISIHRDDEAKARRILCGDINV